jgi:hypothetical protein
MYCCVFYFFAGIASNYSNRVLSKHVLRNIDLMLRKQSVFLWVLRLSGWLPYIYASFKALSVAGFCTRRCSVATNRSGWLLLVRIRLMYCLCPVMFIHTAFSKCKCQNTTSLYCDFIISRLGTIPVCYRMYTTYRYGAWPTNQEITVYGSSSWRFTRGDSNVHAYH